ncbi:CoA transferase [Streptomyces echinatus]|uniref:CoA transferase n=1 Tax=Streptomyces echinatus TaxID=67293 RepID=UPI0037B1923F
MGPLPIPPGVSGDVAATAVPLADTPCAPHLQTARRAAGSHYSSGSFNLAASTALSRWTARQQPWTTEKRCDHCGNTAVPILIIPSPVAPHLAFRLRRNDARRERKRGWRNPSSSAPLDRVRVINRGTVVMGPYAARTLGDLGADVIKIESSSDTVRVGRPRVPPGTTTLNRNANCTQCTRTSPPATRPCRRRLRQTGHRGAPGTASRWLPCWSRSTPAAARCPISPFPHTTHPSRSAHAYP